MRLVITFKGQREFHWPLCLQFDFFHMLLFRLLVQVVKGKRRCHSSATSNVKVNDFPIFPGYTTLLPDSQKRTLHGLLMLHTPASR